MIFREDRPVRFRPCREIEQRYAGETPLGFARWLTYTLQKGWIAVQVRDRRISHYTRRDIGACQDHRHLGSLLVQCGFTPQTPRPEIVSMVAGVDDISGLGETNRFERTQYLANIVVEEAAQRIIR